MSQILQHCSLQKVDPNSSPLDCGLDLVTCFRWIEYDRWWCVARSWKVSWPPPALSLSLRSLSLREANCYVMRTLKQPCGEVHVMRNWGLLPTASEKLRPPANSYESKPSWKQILHPQPSLQITNIPPDSLTKTSWETLSCSWKPEAQKLCEKINAHCFKPLNFEVIGYATTGN